MFFDAFTLYQLINHFNRFERHCLFGENLIETNKKNMKAPMLRVEHL